MSYDPVMVENVVGIMAIITILSVLVATISLVLLFVGWRP